MKTIEDKTSISLLSIILAMFRIPQTREGNSRISLLYKRWTQEDLIADPGALCPSHKLKRNHCRLKKHNRSLIFKMPSCLRAALKKNLDQYFPLKESKEWSFLLYISRWLMREAIHLDNIKILSLWRFRTILFHLRNQNWEGIKVYKGLSLRSAVLGAQKTRTTDLT